MFGYCSIQTQKQKSFSIYFLGCISNGNSEEVVIYAANKKLHVITGKDSGSLVIHNLLGKQLISTTINGNISLDINDLSKGIYLVSFANGTSTITKKVYIE